MSDGDCGHLDTIVVEVANTTGCEDCLAIGSRWLHLRRCTGCGHVGCCDSSPNKHATAHFRSTDHPIVQSYEPGEEWLWCYVDEMAFEVDTDSPSPAHP